MAVIFPSYIAREYWALGFSNCGRSLGLWPWYNWYLATNIFLERYKLLVPSPTCVTVWPLRMCVPPVPYRVLECTARSPDAVHPEYYSGIALECTY